MIKEVKQFLEELFDLESKALQSKRKKEEIEDYNSMVQKMKPFFSTYYETKLKSDIEWGLMSEMKRPMTDFFYDSFDNAPANKERKVLKISLYKSDENEQLSIAYTTIYNPQKIRLYNAFVVGEIEGKMKVRSQYRFDEEDSQWVRANGEVFNNFPSIGNLVEIERYYEPEEGEASLKEYNKDA